MAYPSLPSDTEFERDGYGSVIDTTAFTKTVLAGHGAFKKGQYIEALQEYDKAVHMKPSNVNLKIRRAETLVCLGRYAHALDEFRNASRLDPDNGRLHHIFSVFLLRIGDVKSAAVYVNKASPEYKEDLSAKIEKVQGHAIQGIKEKQDGNWIGALKEVDAIIAAGVNICQAILVFRAEILLRLHELDQAQETINQAILLVTDVANVFQFLSMRAEAYLEVVYAQIELAVGRYDSAIAAADRAHRLDPRNREVSAIKTHVHNECKARRPNSDELSAKIQKWAQSLKDCQNEINESQVTELAGPLVGAQDAVEESQVTEFAGTPVEAQGAVNESQVEDVSED